MLPSFMNATPFTRKRYPSALDHGTLRTNYSGTPTTVAGRGSFQPGVGPTDQVNRDGAAIVYTAYIPPSVDIQHRDLIDVFGKTFEVDGEPERWSVGFLNHQVVRLIHWNS